MRNRIAETPIRPDRARSLLAEGRGHLDRLDMWLLIVLVVAALVLRTYRLAEPARMHFDEVYHARTAMEFLQDWRYGIQHDIYEWTHPHLAKYGIAAGIVAFAGHDVAASSELGVPVADAVIEPRRSDPVSTDTRDGERVWVATGSEVVAFDLATRQRVVNLPIDGAEALAYDATLDQLYVGTSDGGLWVVDVNGLDGVGGFAPGPGADHTAPDRDARRTDLAASRRSTTASTWGRSCPTTGSRSWTRARARSSAPSRSRARSTSRPPGAGMRSSRRSWT